METIQTAHASITEAVVSAVATAEGVEPESVTPRLYDVIDPDALEALFDRQHHDSVTISFTYGEWTVNIADGVVSVAEAPQSAQPIEDAGVV
jgi:hypothetical protein